MSISMKSKGKSIACSSRSSKHGEKGEVANLIATSLAQLAGVMQDKNENLADKVYRALNELVGETYDVTTFELSTSFGQITTFMREPKLPGVFLGSLSNKGRHGCRGCYYLMLMIAIDSVLVHRLPAIHHSPNTALITFINVLAETLLSVL